MNARRVALVFALGGAAGGGVVTALAGCRTQTLAARSNFVEDGVHRESDAGWDAERVEIDNRGVTATGGLALSAIDTDRVSATARILAVADTVDKPGADRAIASVQDGFVVTSTNGVTTVRCGHGQTFGSATGDQTGCDALDVSVPKGAPERPLAVVARSGNGKVVVSFDGAVRRRSHRERAHRPRTAVRPDVTSRARWRRSRHVRPSGAPRPGPSRARGAPP